MIKKRRPNHISTENYQLTKKNSKKEKNEERKYKIDMNRRKRGKLLWKKITFKTCLEPRRMKIEVQQTALFRQSLECQDPKL